MSMEGILRDAFGRTIKYLRVSITDKCNLRCKFCVPPQGMKNFSQNEILNFEEIESIVRVMAKMGVKKIRLTGGEPLVRPGVQDLLRALSGVPGVEELCLTTNGILFSGMAASLKEAGLSRVNVSLNSLDEEKFASITGSRGLAQVLKSVEAALALGFKTKVNCVPCDWNKDELCDIALLAKDKPLDIRFIELMPIGSAFGMKGLSSDFVKARLEARFGKADSLATDEGGRASLLAFEGFKGRVGFISPMTHSFCAECDRLRLASDGKIKLCLCSDEFLDAKKILRSGQSLDKIEEALREEIILAVKRKPKSHSLGRLSDGVFGSMTQIGG